MIRRIVFQVHLSDNLAVHGDLQLRRPESRVCHGVGIERLAVVEGTLAKHVIAINLVTLHVLSEFFLGGSLEKKLS